MTVCRRGRLLHTVGGLVVLESPRRHTMIPVRPACHTLQPANFHRGFSCVRVWYDTLGAIFSL
jgi:hypothetical protein